MKLTKILLLGAVVGGAFIGYSNNAKAEDATGTATAEILAAITLTEDTGMDFGEIIPNAGGDVITLLPAGTATAAGGSVIGGTQVAGGFTATGTALSAVTISYSTGDTLTGPGTAMALGTFTDDAGAAAFDGAGDLNFDVGAQLTIGAAQAAGTYSGTYTATVDYQ